ncbi:extracellular catalytic domain type 2 short-chain-length polyhydroxyalkanoate depolymerase [Flavobacterium sp. W21_SRS_FM6]|uniref:extracellular catalytic domain type 2 short-chain-length polyhydroxyalkanoate depolymerase n=1 Tax=Flavobacterium sp. W21_SRS_FM6 TaxID=3240268 RepID=UPI003F9349CC
MTYKLICLALSISAGSVIAAPQKLDLSLEQISVSGLSSGGYMANQFHLAHSDWVTKIGIIAAGPYYCAQGSIKTALEQCVNQVLSPIDLNHLNSVANTYATEEKISPLTNLKKSKVWLFHGANDNKVKQEVSDALYEQYVELAGKENVKYVNDQAASHLFPTLSEGSDCQQSVSPYIGNCQYDAAGEMFGYLFDDFAVRVDTPQGQIVELDQQQLGGESASTLADLAYAYVPKSCAAGESCSLHISFHGCNQNSQSVGTQYAQLSGLNNWADNNRMVVLYPQTKNSTFMPLNPQGCWDWWGYTGAEYATQQGQQIQAVIRMARSLQHYSIQQ